MNPMFPTLLQLLKTHCLFNFDHFLELFCLSHSTFIERKCRSLELWLRLSKFGLVGQPTVVHVRLCRDLRWGRARSAQSLGQTVVLCVMRDFATDFYIFVHISTYVTQLTSRSPVPAITLGLLRWGFDYILPESTPGWRTETGQKKKLFEKIFY